MRKLLMGKVIFIMRENKRAHMGSSSDNSPNFDSINSLHESRGVKKKQQVHTLFSEGSLICFGFGKNNSTRLPHRLASKGVYSKCNVHPYSSTFWNLSSKLGKQSETIKGPINDKSRPTWLDD